MKVKLLTNIKKDGRMIHIPMEIVDLPDDKAKYMISRGQAVPVPAGAVEAVKVIPSPAGVTKK